MTVLIKRKNVVLEKVKVPRGEGCLRFGVRFQFIAQLRFPSEKHAYSLRGRLCVVAKTRGGLSGRVSSFLGGMPLYNTPPYLRLKSAYFFKGVILRFVKNRGGSLGRGVFVLGRDVPL